VISGKSLQNSTVQAKNVPIEPSRRPAGVSACNLKDLDQIAGKPPCQDVYPTPGHEKDIAKVSLVPIYVHRLSCAQETTHPSLYTPCSGALSMPCMGTRLSRASASSRVPVPILLYSQIHTAALLINVPGAFPLQRHHHLFDSRQLMMLTTIICTFSTSMHIIKKRWKQALFNDSNCKAFARPRCSLGAIQKCNTDTSWLLCAPSTSVLKGHGMNFVHSYRWQNLPQH
jgi:hypothetical protein